ncbi:unnamed protein product [Ectocarpus sp. 8 AP-2014]
MSFSGHPRIPSPAHDSAEAQTPPSMASAIPTPRPINQLTAPTPSLNFELTRCRSQVCGPWGMTRNITVSSMGLIFLDPSRTLPLTPADEACAALLYEPCAVSSLLFTHDIRGR